MCSSVCRILFARGVIHTMEMNLSYGHSYFACMESISEGGWWGWREMVEEFKALVALREILGSDPQNPQTARCGSSCL